MSRMAMAPHVNPASTTFGGQRWPDIVGALHVKQGWGEAQVSGVIHNVNVRDYTYFNTGTCGITAAGAAGTASATRSKTKSAGLSTPA